MYVAKNQRFSRVRRQESTLKHEGCGGQAQLAGCKVTRQGSESELSTVMPALYCVYCRVSYRVVKEPWSARSTCVEGEGCGSVYKMRKLVGGEWLLSVVLDLEHHGGGTGDGDGEHGANDLLGIRASSGRGSCTARTGRARSASRAGWSNGRGRTRSSSGGDCRMQCQ